MNMPAMYQRFRLACVLSNTAPCWSSVALSFVAMLLPALATARIALVVTLAPPELPVYAQPAVPEDGMLWTPGYWQYGPDGYYWVPGAWMMPPLIGLLWTPGYWRWSDRGYLWNDGYWSREIGYYGGINYGHGYVGNGYQGGYWDGVRFFYNCSVNNVVQGAVHNVYSRAVESPNCGRRTSFNGGTGGTSTRPSTVQIGQAHEARQGPTPAQSAHRSAASHDRTMLATESAGHPPGVVAARASAPPPRAAAVSRDLPVHIRDVPTVPEVAPDATGNAERDTARQHALATLSDQQARERRTLLDKQEQEHSALAGRPSTTSEHVQLEQQHQVQTRDLVMRHSSEQEGLRQTMESGSADRTPHQSRPVG